MSSFGFSSTPWIASGPFAWKVDAVSGDRGRLATQRALFKLMGVLRVRGAPSLSLRLKRVLGGYGEPLVARFDDVGIAFDGFDRYWMQFFFRRDFYEPDMYRLFSRASRLDTFSFVDGGANIGFWTAILTSRRFGIRRAVAIEASPTTFETLGHTARACGGRFEVVNKALTAQPGTVSFEQGLRHESRRIAFGDTNGERVTVSATTVDLVVRDHGFDPGRTIIKLDVEGAELDCVSGGTSTLESGGILIYEDHGKDPTSKVTGGLIARGFACWFIDDDGHLRRVASATEASAMKLNPQRGYNFVAVVARVASDLHERLGLGSDT